MFNKRNLIKVITVALMSLAGAFTSYADESIAVIVDPGVEVAELSDSMFHSDMVASVSNGEVGVAPNDESGANIDIASESVVESEVSSDEAEVGTTTSTASSVAPDDVPGVLDGGQVLEIINSLTEDVNVNIPVPTAEEVQAEAEARELNAHLGESLGTFKLTAYCPCRKCNGNNPPYAANGAPLVPYHTVAVDKHVIPLGTPIYINIPGQGWKLFVAEDTGSGVHGNRIDVLLPAHNMCYDAAYNGRCEVRLAL